MNIKLKDIIELLADRHTWVIRIDEKPPISGNYFKKDEITYGMLNMYVDRIGTCVHEGVDHLVIMLRRNLPESDKVEV